MMLAQQRTAAWLFALSLLLIAAPALAAPSFPALTGRVVDDAHVLSAPTIAALTTELAELEARTGRQFVVATIPSLQGYEIEDYGYQLGSAWALGRKGEDDGAILLVAPNERKVRIEVGYGLEPVLTDALSSVILQSRVLPKFRAGDMEGGIREGAAAIVQQLSLPDDEAKANVAKAAEAPAQATPPVGAIIGQILFFALIVFLLSRRGRRGGASALPWIVLGSALGSRRDSDSWRSGGGGGGFSSGGFSGGGGSFGGGGASGSW